MDTTSNTQIASQARPIGRLLRLITGLVVLGVVAPAYLQIPTSWLAGVIGVFVGIVVFYLALHVVIVRYFGKLNPWVGAALANLPVLALFVFGSPVVQIGAGTYLGLALTLAGVRADPGCEVMSIPGFLLGRHTHLACLVFSPIDWIESRLAKRED